MRASSRRNIRLASVLSAGLGLLLVGVAATPAHAESVRDLQWHLDAMHAEEMWKVSTGRGITVAVIDTGVDDSLPDLKGQVLKGKDYSDQPGDERTDHEGHGTGMAALIAGTGKHGSESGAYGLAPGVEILPIRMPEKIEGLDFTSGHNAARDFSKAIRFAADSDAKVINISMGQAESGTKGGVNTPELDAAVKYAVDKGKLIFAAAGNEGAGANRPRFPASTPGVVAVGSINEKVKRSSFSEWGPEIDVTAPGEDLVHACIGGTGVCRTSGTSDATAIASASAALVWSKHPTWTNNQVLRVLINTMKGNEEEWTHNESFGYGIVRPRVALQNPGDPGPADEYPLPDLAAAAVSKSPSPETSPSGDAAENAAGDTSQAAASASEDDSSTSLWIALGVAAAVILGAAITFAVLRTRRRRVEQPAATVPPATPAYAPPQQYPPHGTPGSGQQD
ncbi:type VII secretion-associated serine protease mycosin [Streptomyces sp. E5N91]|uniref:type VII secretion-associated serine protease mycosin n=1 Tax=Streptomyces sp. E5N91 TaxID=1851996 RepID=UPI000EF6160D|nr:type VII secretion-associated serine protease mycosin [Streptomyces sp. E5N91]